MRQLHKHQRDQIAHEILALQQVPDAPEPVVHLAQLMQTLLDIYGELHDSYLKQTEMLECSQAHQRAVMQQLEARRAGK